MLAERRDREINRVLSGAVVIESKEADRRAKGFNFFLLIALAHCALQVENVGL